MNWIDEDRPGDLPGSRKGRKVLSRMCATPKAVKSLEEAAFLQGVEFGFVQAEKGHNLQMTLELARAAIAEWQEIELWP